MNKRRERTLRICYRWITLSRSMREREKQSMEEENYGWWDIIVEKCWYNCRSGVGWKILLLLFKQSWNIWPNKWTGLPVFVCLFFFFFCFLMGKREDRKILLLLFKQCWNVSPNKWTGLPVCFFFFFFKWVKEKIYIYIYIK